MPHSPSSPSPEVQEKPKKSWGGRILIGLVLCGAYLTDCEQDLDAYCKDEGYDGMSDGGKKRWIKIQKREVAKGNDADDILLGLEDDRSMCYGYDTVSKIENGEERIKVVCKGWVGNCSGKRQK